MLRKNSRKCGFFPRSDHSKPVKEDPNHGLWFDVPTEVKKDHIEKIQQDGKVKAEVSEIEALLKVSGNVRNNAIILTLRDSGLRASDIARLKIKHIEPILDDTNIQFYCFDIIPEKNMSKESIQKKVKRRVVEYGVERDSWFREWFMPLMDHIKVSCISWEEIIEGITSQDAIGGNSIKEFYNLCCKYNSQKED